MRTHTHAPFILHLNKDNRSFTMVLAHRSLSSCLSLTFPLKNHLHFISHWGVHKDYKASFPYGKHKLGHIFRTKRAHKAAPLRCFSRGERERTSSSEELAAFLTVTPREAEVRTLCVCVHHHTTLPTLFLQELQGPVVKLQWGWGGAQNAPTAIYCVITRILQVIRHAAWGSFTQHTQTPKSCAGKLPPLPFHRGCTFATKTGLSHKCLGWRFPVDRVPILISNIPDGSYHFSAIQGCSTVQLNPREATGCWHLPLQTGGRQEGDRGHHRIQWRDRKQGGLENYFL